MRRIFWICSFIIPSTLFAAAPERFECNPDPDSPTYQLTRKNDSTYSVRAYFPNNIQTAPIFSGDLSLAGVQHILRKADFVQAMGTTYEVDIPASQCIRQKHSSSLFYIHCYSKTPITLGTKELQGLSFHATSKQLTALTWANGSYVPITDEQVTVGIEVGTPTHLGTHWYDFSRTYLLSECRITENFWK